MSHAVRWTTHYIFLSIFDAELFSISWVNWLKVPILSGLDWRWSTRNEYYTQKITFCRPESSIFRKMKPQSRWTSALEVRWAIGKTYSNPTYFNNRYRYTRRILHLGINKLCDLIDQSSRLLLSSTYYSKYLNSHTLWRPSQHTCTRPLHKKTYMEDQRSGFLDHLCPQTQAGWESYLSIVDFLQSRM